MIILFITPFIKLINIEIFIVKIIIIITFFPSARIPTIVAFFTTVFGGFSVVFVPVGGDKKGLVSAYWRFW